MITFILLKLLSASNLYTHTINFTHKIVTMCLRNGLDIVGRHNATVASKFTYQPLSIDLFLDDHHIASSEA